MFRCTYWVLIPLAILLVIFTHTTLASPALLEDTTTLLQNLLTGFEDQAIGNTWWSSSTGYLRATASCIRNGTNSTCGPLNWDRLNPQSGLYIFDDIDAFINTMAAQQRFTALQVRNVGELGSQLTIPQWAKDAGVTASAAQEPTFQNPIQLANVQKDTTGYYALGQVTVNASTATSLPTQTATQIPTVTNTPIPSPIGPVIRRPIDNDPTWSLAFSDDFNGNSLDTSKWSTCYWYGCSNFGNNELEWYQPDDVIVNNGTLRLRAQPRSMNGYSYTSGLISSHEKFEFKYGYAEARMKVPSGKGLWPAFWLEPLNTWPPELDIMELIGQEPNKVAMTIHYLTGGADDSDSSTYTSTDFSTDYHTFGVSWQPDVVIWYVDGVERKRYTNATNIANMPLHLIANLAVGGVWPGDPDSNTQFPAYLDIDYIKVWQRCANCTTTPTPSDPGPAAPTSIVTATAVPSSPTPLNTMTATASAATGIPRLQVSSNGHYLVQDNGTPFFWLGDTAWQLFDRLKRDEVEQYLENRRQKGFNVIQAIVLFGDLTEPNVYGQLPLINKDPLQPNDAYFQNVDYIVSKAAEKGIYIGLLPTSGDKVNLSWGPGPVIFDASNARSYGQYLGNRYRNATNIIWILGGDREVADSTQAAIWRAMAAGIEAGAGGNPLMTYHPQGWTRSSTWFQQDAWLDFNMIQSGHSHHDIPVWDWISGDFGLSPAKPTVDGESNYEDHPVGWDSANGFFTDYDVRKQAYRSVFAGALGHTYGHNSIWQFYAPDRMPQIDAQYYWTAAMDRPGAVQMTFLRRLMESRPFLNRIPDQGLLATPVGTGGDHIQATRASDGSYALIYIPTTQTITVNTNKLSGNAINAWWYDPRSGSAAQIGTYPKTNTMTFTTPNSGPDWVLVLDDSAQPFTIPGSTNQPNPVTPTVSSTETQTSEPAITATVTPTQGATDIPTTIPTATVVPSATPTVADLPTTEPTIEPSVQPTDLPTDRPPVIEQPTTIPTATAAATSTATQTPAGSGHGFYRAINLNGPALTIDGNAWEGSNAFNYTTNGWNICKADSELVPSTDDSRAQMLRCAIFKDNLSLTLTSVPNGTYDVYLYVWENDWPEIYSVYLKGQPVVSNYNSIGAGYWAKLGPWTTTVTDGKIDITSTGWFSNLSGIEVWQHDGPGATPPDAATPTLLPAPTQTNTPVPTSAATTVPTVNQIGTPANPSPGTPNTAFYRAINLNGPALTIDGNAWEGSNASNYTTNGWNICKADSVLVPQTDDSRAQMLRCAVFKDNLSLNINAVPDGTYDVYLYVWENDWPEIYSVYLQGQPVVTNYNSIGAGYWAKLGPWTTTVTNGAVAIISTGWFSNLSGIEIWRHDPATPLSPVTATTTPTLAPTTAIATLADTPTIAPSPDSSTAAPSGNNATAAPTVPLQLIESDNPAVQQNGQWTLQDAAAASGGRYLYSSGNLSDTLSLTFQGSSLDIVYVQHPSLGTFAVDIDGSTVLTVATTATKSIFGTQTTIRNLTAGIHRLRIYPVNGTVAVDAFAAEAILNANPTATFTPTAAPMVATTPAAPANTAPPTLPATITSAGSTSTTTPTSIAPAVALPYVESFDSGANWQATGAWQIQPGYRGQGWFVNTAQRGQVNLLDQIGPIDLHSATNPQLTFWQKATLSSSDIIAIDLTLDGGMTWLTIDQQSALVTDWGVRTLDLKPYRGQVIRLRFRLDTTQSLAPNTPSIGYWLDELTVQDVVAPTATATTPAPVAPTTVPATPTAIPATSVPTSVPPTLTPTHMPPTPTLVPTILPTAIPPTLTPIPTVLPPTPVPPTAIPPTLTPVPTAVPTNTPVQVPASPTDMPSMPTANP